MRILEPLLARVFLVFLIIVVVFIMTEMGANYYLWNIATEDQFKEYASIDQIKQRYGENYFHELNQSELQPHHYLGYIPAYNYQNNVNFHNSLGYRGEEFSLEKPENTFRIVAIGSSETYGIDVNRPQNAYPPLLQEYIEEHGYTNVEVINAGVGGYTSYEVLMNLQFRVLELDPDLVIVYLGSTDIHARIVWPPEAYRADNSGYRASYIPAPQTPQLWEQSTVLRLLGHALGWNLTPTIPNWSRTVSAPTSYYNELGFQHDTLTYPSGIFSETSALEMVKANPPTYFERNLRTIVASAQVNGVDVLLLTYVVSADFVEFYKSNSEEYLLGTDQHNEIIRKVANDLNTYFIDLEALYPLDDINFTDGRHMTRDGHLVFAQLIGDYLIENGIID